MRKLGLEELEKLDPAKLQIESPESEPMYAARLRWLMDNEPARVSRLFREKPEKLKAELLRNLQVASLELERLKAKGEPRDAAEEKVLGRIVAPPEGPALSSSPPDPLPENEEIEILSALLS